MSDSGMSTHSIKGEDHYKCREVKAERDRLRAEVERFREVLTRLISMGQSGESLESVRRAARAALEGSSDA